MNKRDQALFSLTAIDMNWRRYYCSCTPATDTWIHILISQSSLRCFTDKVATEQTVVTLTAILVAHSCIIFKLK